MVVVVLHQCARGRLLDRSTLNLSSPQAPAPRVASNPEKALSRCPLFPFLPLSRSLPACALSAGPGGGSTLCNARTPQCYSAHTGSASAPPEPSVYKTYAHRELTSRQLHHIRHWHVRHVLELVHLLRLSLELLNALLQRLLALLLGHGLALGGAQADRGGARDLDAVLDGDAVRPAAGEEGGSGARCIGGRGEGREEAARAGREAASRAEEGGRRCWRDGRGKGLRLA
jgi:hypothetical protein